MGTRQTVLILMLVFVLGIFAARLPAGFAPPGGGPGDPSPYTALDPVIDIYHLVDAEYVDRPDSGKLLTGAINGMLESLEDTYTQYIPPADRAAFQKEMTGQFVGIGAEVTIQGGYLTIVSPIEDSPAYNAGIRPNDRVVEIEGQTTLNMPIDECIGKLTGKPGEAVHVLVERGGAGGQRIAKTIVRQHIVVRAVKGIHREAPTDNGGEADAPSPEHAPRWDYLIDPEQRIGYIRLTQFTPTAADELKDALGEINAQRSAGEGGLRGLILDLRDDPGGVLDAALEIADLFIKDGTIVSVKGRAGGDEIHRAKGEGTLPEFPMAVLVNGQSASASEIVSGALADHKRAVIIGTRTFGKGLVQAVKTLKRPDGAQIKITSQRYYLPSGRLIQRTDQSDTWGVDPTPGFYVPMTEQEQLARRIERHDRDIVPARPDGAPVPEPANGAAPAAGSGPERWTDPEWIGKRLKDKQLAAAVKAMQARLGAPDWTPVSDATEQPEKINITELHQLQVGRERVLRELARVERRMTTLENVAAGDAKAKTEPIDLWPNDLDLAGGHLDVFDKDGKRITTLNITGPNLERWLIDADVKPAEKGTPGPEKAEKKD